MYPALFITGKTQNEPEFSMAHCSWCDLHCTSHSNGGFRMHLHAAQHNG
jgi:hypothetical protein